MQKVSSKQTFDFNDSISDHRTSATRLEDPNYQGVQMDSFLLSPERKMAKGDIIYVSKGEIERELHEFIELLSQKKGLNQNDLTDYLEHLKKMVISLIKENTRLMTFAENYCQGSESGFHEGGNEQLHERLIALEVDRVKYEEKLEVHGVYITELESKINEMIREYIKVLERNEDLSTQLQLLLGTNSYPTGTSLRSVTGPTLEKLGNLIENEEKLYEENNKIKNELAAARQRLNQFEAGAPKIEVLKNVTIPKVQMNGKEQETLIHNLQTQNADLQRENALLKQSLKGLEEKFTSQCSQYLLQIEQLAEGLHQADYHLRLANNKCEHLQKLSQTRSEMENLLKLRAEIIQDLEEKLENLAHENNELTKINEENSLMVVNLKSQIYDTNTNVQRRGHKSYSHVPSNSDHHEDKVGSLLNANAQLSKELENLREEFIKNRKGAWAITKDLKRYIDNYKEFDTEIVQQLATLAVHNSQEFIQLQRSYEKARNEVIQISEFLEERQKKI